MRPTQHQPVRRLRFLRKIGRKVQNVFRHMGLKGDLETRVLTPLEIGAVTAAFTGYLYLQEKTELIGEGEEGYIVFPAKGEWRRLKL